MSISASHRAVCLRISVVLIEFTLLAISNCVAEIACLGIARLCDYMFTCLHAHVVYMLIVEYIEIIYGIIDGEILFLKNLEI